MFYETFNNYHYNLLFCLKFNLQRNYNFCKKAFPKQLLQRDPCLPSLCPRKWELRQQPHPQLLKLSTSCPAEDNVVIYITNKTCLLLLFYFILFFRGGLPIGTEIFLCNTYSLKLPVYAHTFQFICACNINSKSSIQTQVLGKILLYT